MMNDRPGFNKHITNTRFNEEAHFNSEAFLRELEADLLDEEPEGRYKDPYSPSGQGFGRIPDMDRIPVTVRRVAPPPPPPSPQRSDHVGQGSPSRPTLTSKCMLKGLIEQADHFNKAVDQKVMTDARIAFEEEQLKNRRAEDALTSEIEVLALSSQNIQKRGRGDSFGKLRSANIDSPTGFSNNNTSQYNNGFSKPKPRTFTFASYQPPPEDNKPSGRFGSSQQPARHQFNPETAYKGIITPDYRFNYNPQAASSQPVLQPTTAATLIRPGQRYPKRPDNNPQLPSVPKHLNHNYYNIELYGATQDERIAQRIEKTVRQTESPIRRF
uniref:Uncharacterized protein n=1 Tax=Caenorhabditis tropicalis TaxID=1561998 RepID=A0A1I7TLX2_9PELO